MSLLRSSREIIFIVLLIMLSASVLSNFAPFTDNSMVFNYGASGQLEQSKNNSMFNTDEGEKWQTFTFTRAGAYRAVLNGTYNGKVIRIPKNFIVSSTTIQFDVFNLVCPSTATYGESITCSANFTRMDSSGDAQISYYLVGSSNIVSEAFYLQQGNSSMRTLTLPVDLYGTVVFKVIESQSGKYAETSFNVGGQQAVPSGGFIFNPAYYVYGKRISYYLGWVVGGLVLGIFIFIFYKRRKDEKI